MKMLLIGCSSLESAATLVTLAPAPVLGDRGGARVVQGSGSIQAGREPCEFAEPAGQPGASGVFRFTLR